MVCQSEKYNIATVDYLKMEVLIAIQELLIQLQIDGLSKKRINEIAKKPKSTVQYSIET